MTWLDEIKLRIFNYVGAIGKDDTLIHSAQAAIDDLELMARVIRELADVASATVPAYKRLVLLQKMGPLGESPLWTKKIGEALDNLSPDAKEVI